MKLFGKVTGILVVMGLCLALSWDAVGAPAVKKGKTPDPKQGATKTDPAAAADLLTAPLFPADTIAKLKLTAEQKSDYDKLAKEFDDQLKKIAAGGNTTGNTTTPPKGKDKGKGKGTAATPATPAAQAISLRGEYEDKVEKLLTEAQKKTLDDIRAAKATAGNNPLNPGGKK